MIKNKKQKKNKGFTLVEIMVAVSIFSIVMMIAIGAVLAIVSANRKAQSLSSVVNNLNFAFESMVRDLRTGEKYVCGEIIRILLATDCPQGSEVPDNSKISFKSSQFDSFDSVSYGLFENRIAKYTNGSSRTFLTAPEVKIDDLRFYVVGSESNTDSVQPHILVVLKGHYGESATEKSSFSLQTFISQRKLDI